MRPIEIVAEQVRILRSAWQGTSSPGDATDQQLANEVLAALHAAGWRIVWAPIQEDHHDSSPTTYRLIVTEEWTPEEGT